MGSASAAWARGMGSKHSDRGGLSPLESLLYHPVFIMAALILLWLLLLSLAIATL